MAVDVAVVEAAVVVRIVELVQQHVDDAHRVLGVAAQGVGERIGALRAAEIVAVLHIAPRLRVEHRVGEGETDVGPVLDAGVDVVDPVVKVGVEQVVERGPRDERVAGEEGDELRDLEAEVEPRAVRQRLQLKRIAQLEDTVEQHTAVALHHELLVTGADLVAGVEILLDGHLLAVVRDRLNEIVAVVIVEAVRREALAGDEALVLEAAASALESVGRVVDRDGGDRRVRHHHLDGLVAARRARRLGDERRLFHRQCRGGDRLDVEVAVVRRIAEAAGG